MGRLLSSTGHLTVFGDILAATEGGRHVVGKDQGGCWVFQHKGLPTMYKIVFITKVIHS